MSLACSLSCLHSLFLTSFFNFRTDQHCILKCFQNWIEVLIPGTTCFQFQNFMTFTSPSSVRYSSIDSISRSPNLILPIVLFPSTIVSSANSNDKIISVHNSPLTSFLCFVFYRKVFKPNNQISISLSKFQKLAVLRCNG